jgi:hypothetical protein
MSAKSVSAEDALRSQRLSLRVARRPRLSSLIRVLQFFQHLNVVPGRVVAESLNRAGVAFIFRRSEFVSPQF